MVLKVSRIHINFLVYLVGAFLLLISGAYALSALTENFPIKEFTQNLGLWGYLFLLIGITIGGILVPFSCIPFLLTGLAIYDFWTTFVIYYIGNTVLAPIIDFYLARRFGRPLVAKLAGKRALKEIDKIAEYSGVKALAILRLLGGVLFDSISYAIGLTNMSFRTYMVMTGLLSIPGMLFSLYLINKGLYDNPLFLGIIVIWGYVAGVVTLYLVYREKKNISKAV